MAKRSSKSTKSRALRAARRSGDHAIEVIVRGVWIERGCVLLARSRDKGYLALPGGHVEFDESAAAALEREILEETGERVEVGNLALVTENAYATRKRRHHEINLVFHVERPVSRTVSARRGEGPPLIRPREPDIAFEWIDLAATVDLDIRPTAVKAWLAAGAGDAARIEWISEMPR